MFTLKLHQHEFFRPLPIPLALLTTEAILLPATSKEAAAGK